ncbi:hypothetical protein MMC07_006034 [Pseudocyphellaria aurata]|nr:hypothetical protein [Pseudocyphellaria aurata]
MFNPINHGQDLERDHNSTQNDSPANLVNPLVAALTEPLQYVASDSDRFSSDPEKQGTPEATRTVTQTTTGSNLTVESQNWQSKGAENRVEGTGYQRPLEVNDIWLVNPERQVDVLSDKLRNSFKRRAARGDKHPLLWAMHETFHEEFWIGGLCSLLSSILTVLSPFTLRYLIKFSTQAYYAQEAHTSGPLVGNGVGLAIGITLLQISQSLATNHFLYRGQMVGGEVRGVLVNIIFEKAMRLSGRAKAGGRAIEDGHDQANEEKASSDTKDGLLKERLKTIFRPKSVASPGALAGVSGDGAGWGNGRVINLMSTDTYRIDQASGFFHMIWTSPVIIILTLVLLLVNLSYSALAGFALLVIGSPILYSTIKRLFVRRRAINKITDQRVSLTQEILQSVRFVKYFGWESSFLERIGNIRKREIRSVQILLAIRNGINAVSMSLPIFASMLSFITYSLSQHVLDPAPIFSSLALFNALRFPLSLLPLVIGQVIDAWASVGRIQDFLLAEEQDDDFVWDMESKSAFCVDHADFTWERTVTQVSDSDGGSHQQVPDQAKELEKSNAKSTMPRTPAGETDGAGAHAQAEPFKLHDMNLSIKRNELIAVIGGVGSGKSSLLAALAGEMRRTSGSVTIGAGRAFCPQYAWIQNATVRENILFGKEYDREWYDRVVDACALRPDLEMLPNNDQTEIGERGITISGGQKQRLNIARAIYFNSDIVIMDDPLSAVDAHVGRHIFDRAICGLMQGKCRILATHQLHVLYRCDRIVWMREGRIDTVDTFDNLMRYNEGFQKLMASTAQEEKEKEVLKEGEVVDQKRAAKKRKAAKKGAALMQQEERAVKSVSWGVYGAYIRASGTILNGPLVVILLILSQGCNIVTSLWLSWWTSNKFGYSTGTYIGAYAALGTVQALLMFAFSLALTFFGTTSSKVLLQRAMTRVLRAPMSFFDTTPLGRITNRFSKDVDSMDNNLTDAMRLYMLTLATIISVFILIIVYFYYFAIALGPLFVVFLFAAGYYRASAREVKRHESVLRSDMFARFSEGVSGTSSIRAYGLQNHFIRGLQLSIDQMNSAYYLTFSNQRWLSVRLDLIGNLLVLTTGILVVTSRFNVSPSISGLVLSYIVSNVQMIQFTVRQLAEVENNMIATERIHYYGTQLDEEPPLKLGQVDPSWPQKGEIVFDEVQMRYREGLPLVLHGVNMTVAGGERIGVVGRTGAGKSSIMSTLFRLVELSGGSIRIDGVDIATVGLKDLRTRLAIIPQDPALFRGTIRSNLDPFHEHSDLELWSALRQSDLVDGTATTRDDDSTSQGRVHLDAVVEEEGLNFSLGQRQLMALARALVRGSQIIVCDEATSSVDLATDQTIQRTMATAFRGKTLLCIAHRLKTVITYDRICVMDQGRIVELDQPLRLWEEGGLFRSMCDQSGIRREDFLEEKETNL